MVYSAKQYEILPNYKQHLTNNIDKILPKFCNIFFVNRFISTLDPKLIVLLKLISAKIRIQTWGIQSPQKIKLGEPLGPCGPPIPPPMTGSTWQVPTCCLKTGNRSSFHLIGRNDDMSIHWCSTFLFWDKSSLYWERQEKIAKTR